VLMVLVVVVVVAEGAKCAGVITQQPQPNWQKEYYPVVVGRDLIGSGVRRSSQVVVE
jgi:hypothetical protein